jgi:hypothetical protein
VTYMCYTCNMADLNIRNVDPTLIAEMKAEAAMLGSNLKSYVMATLVARIRPGEINGNLIRTDYEHNRVDNRREQIGRSLDGLAVSFVREAEKPAERLRALPAVRDQLVGGDGPDAEPAREACSYREYDPDTGETYGCALAIHGPKVRHVRGAKV